MDQKVATVFGATGFLGRHVVRLLANDGYIVRAATRNPQKAYFLRVYGDVGQIVPVQVSSDDPGSIDAAVRGADAVVFLPGILHARGRRGFERVHSLFAAQVAEAATRHNVRRLAHVSALACERGASRYAQSKRAGEGAVMQAFPNAVVLRPSIMFGHEDGFFGRFARLSKILPCLPLLGGGRTQFQPVYVGDVAAAIFAAITLPSGGPRNPEGRVYELGGDKTYSFAELMRMMLAQTGVKRALVNVPYGIASVQGAVLQCLPNPLLTRDQVVSLKTDNVVSPGAMTLADLGITATALETVLPGIMARFADGPMLKKKRTA